MGSRGSGYEREGFLHGNNGGGGGNGTPHFPVEANVRIKNKTTDGALQEFRNKHVSEDHEYAYVIDGQGYVHEYNEGDYGSVAVHNTKGGHVIHNHPSGGDPAFSYEDLELFANGKAQSMTASSKKYDYTIERGTHFDEDGFRKALSKAKLKGGSYSEAVHNWMLDNAGKYGFKYKRNTYNNNGVKVHTTKSSTKPKGKKGNKK